VGPAGALVRGPAGALVSSPYSTRSTECPKGSPLGQGCSPKFLDEIFSLIQRNSQDEVLGVFMIENLVINNFKRERERDFQPPPPGDLTSLTLLVLLFHFFSPPPPDAPFSLTPPPPTPLFCETFIISCNRPSNVISFIPDMTSTSVCLHNQFVLLLLSQTRRQTTTFLYLQEFNLCKPTVDSSTTGAWRSPHNSNLRSVTSSPRLRYYRLLSI
jgi:hypothetical protein